MDHTGSAVLVSFDLVKHRMISYRSMLPYEPDSSCAAVLIVMF